MEYNDAYQAWLDDPAIDQNTKDELEEIRGNEYEKEDRFYRELEFGTGGLRGVLGAGTNRLNIYTIRKATQGFANYIKKSADYAPGMAVAIAHDNRKNSPLFSTEAALVLNANGIKTYTFDSLRPTPLLSFAVRHLRCIAGIVVTASHNPPEYNGYKVYWSDGGQCCYPRDEEIIAEVSAIKGFAEVKTMPQAEAKAKHLFNIAPPEVDDAFIAEVKAQCLQPEIIPASDMKIVYTPLHGAGNVPVRRALSEAGFKHVFVESKQEKPDENFTHAPNPNPESRDAYTRAIDLAREKDADIIIATDPDADRVGVAVKHDGDYTLLTGNQTGVILASYIVAHGRLPKNSAIISTIVSTDMARAVAEASGLVYMETLTGFKYIGELIKGFEEDGSHTYGFGFEESYGYLSGTHARDKDAVGASLLICEAAAYYQTKGQTLCDALQALYEKHGLYRENIESITLKGADGQAEIARIMAALREKPPETLANSPVIEARDYKNRTIKNLATGEISTCTLPVSDVLYFVTEDASWTCVRPSGTEPKIKLYFGAKLPAAATESDAQKKLSALAADMKTIVDRVLM